MTSFRNSARRDRRRVKRLSKPDHTKMYAIYDPGKRMWLYFKSKRKRDQRFNAYLESGKITDQAKKI